MTAGTASGPTSLITSKPPTRGICMSRKSRSGASSLMALTASAPSAHSPTTFTPGISPNIFLSLSLEGPSSSTISVRMLSMRAPHEGSDGSRRSRRGRAHANIFCGELFISYGVKRAVRGGWYIPARAGSAPVTPFASRKPLRPKLA
jgi:hypothetical protein